MGITAGPSGVKGHWSCNFNCVEYCGYSHLLFPTASVKWVLLALSTDESITSQSCWLRPRESQITDGLRAGRAPTTVWHSLITLLQASPSSCLRFHLAVKVSLESSFLLHSAQASLRLGLLSVRWMSGLDSASESGFPLWATCMNKADTGLHRIPEMSAHRSQQGNKTTRNRATGG